MFSIIVPLYNKEKNIHKTLLSIINQSFEDFEVIVVNDGSTDKSPKIVKSIGDPRIRLIHQTNKGVSTARNRGIREAKYHWICFLDGDDLWEPNHLIEYNKAILSDSNINWLISGFATACNSEKTPRLFQANGRLNNIFDAFLQGIKIHTSTVCVRKALFKKYTDLYFRDGLNNSEDREVWYKLACVDQRPYYINKILSIYSLNNRSLSKSKQARKENNFLTMWLRLKQFDGFCNLDVENQYKLKMFIDRYNVASIKANYVKGNFDDKYKKHLNWRMYWTLRITSSFPKVIRKIILKMC